MNLDLSVTAFGIFGGSIGFLILWLIDKNIKRLKEDRYKRFSEEVTATFAGSPSSEAKKGKQ